MESSDGIVPKIINFFNLIKCKNNCLTILNNEYTGMGFPYVRNCKKLLPIIFQFICDHSANTFKRHWKVIIKELNFCNLMPAELNL